MTEPVSEQEPPLPPSLRFLKVLVTTLAAIMVLGVGTIILLMLVYINDNRRPVLVHPDVFEFPIDVETVGYSVINGYTVLVGDDGVIRVYASDTRALVDTLDLNE